MRAIERVSIPAFVDTDDHERLVERARSEDRSVSAELRVAIREHLAQGVPSETDAATTDGDGGRRESRGRF